MVDDLFAVECSEHGASERLNSPPRWKRDIEEGLVQDVQGPTYAGISKEAFPPARKTEK